MRPLELRMWHRDGGRVCLEGFFFFFPKGLWKILKRPNLERSLKAVDEVFRDVLSCTEKSW